MHLLMRKSDGGKMRVQRRVVTCRIRIMTNKIKTYTCKHKIVCVWEKRSAGSPRLTGESVLSRGAWWRRCTTADRGVARSSWVAQQATDGRPRGMVKQYRKRRRRRPERGGFGVFMLCTVWWCAWRRGIIMIDGTVIIIVTPKQRRPRRLFNKCIIYYYIFIQYCNNNNNNNNNHTL